MMKSARTVIAYLLAMFVSAGSTYAADRQATVPPGSEAPTSFLGGFLRETRIIYPLKLGEWSATREERYDKPEDGVSVRYQHGSDTDRWADVYFYPVGVLSDEEIKQVADGERRGLQQVWLQGPDAKQDDISELRRYTFSPLSMPGDKDSDKPTPRTAYSVDLTYESKGDRRNSAMVVLFQQMYMLKTRYSVQHGALSRHEVRGQLEGFTADLARQVNVSSTGGCWKPLPIEPLVEGKKVPEGSLLSMQTDGVATEYVYPDRVLARDPSSIGAKAAAMLGMAMLDRLYPGCDGSEPENPEVPQGMREIRIEYRVPADEVTPSASPAPARTSFG